jgi:hypothetical protein
MGKSNDPLWDRIEAHRGRITGLVGGHKAERAATIATMIELCHREGDALTAFLIGRGLRVNGDPLRALVEHSCGESSAASWVTSVDAVLRLALKDNIAPERVADWLKENNGIKRLYELHGVHRRRGFVLFANSGVSPSPWTYLTPLSTIAALTDEFGPLFDVCPYPRRPGYDALKVPWHPTRANLCNPPYRDEGDGGPTAFVRKGIAEAALGKTVLFLLPTTNWTNMLLEAGAAMRSMGRVPWIAAETGEPRYAPGPVVLYVLGGQRD